MKIIKEEYGFYIYKFEFDFSLEKLEFCRWLNKVYGWQEIRFIGGKWRFKSIDIINTIIQRYNEVDIDNASKIDYIAYLEQHKELSIQRQNANEIKKKKDTDLVINNIKGELYPYQKVGVEFFINNNGKAILADTMGLGKTATSLAFIAHTGKQKTLVICPASVKYSWEKEIKKWTDMTYYIIDSNTDVDINEFKDKQIIIINYDLLKKYYEILIKYQFECAIIDEFHYIKSNTALRTKAVKTIVRNIPSILLLSGTPLLSRPVELFNGLNLMDSRTWNNWYKYTVKYCGGHKSRFGWDSRGATNIEELQNSISKYFLRRTKDEVLTELPPKRFIDIPVVLSSEKKFEYDLVMSSFIEYLREIKKKNKDEINRSMHAEQLVKLNELRQITSTGKVDSAKEIIQNIIDGGEKVVVFSVYNEPLKQLYEEFKDIAVMVTGETPEKTRQVIIDTFQKKDNIKIFLGGIKSTGVGITLTSASNVLFIDYSWVPADHWQASDRIHRIGQTADSVSIYQLYSKNTIDEKMKNILESKKEIFEQLIDGKAVVNNKSNLMNDLIKEIRSEELST
jgi:SWI/SNF-related matrix-associated actin-dependent regulator 1 of chromatin subfamily A